MCYSVWVITLLAPNKPYVDVYGTVLFWFTIVKAEVYISGTKVDFVFIITDRSRCFWYTHRCNYWPTYIHRHYTRLASPSSTSHSSSPTWLPTPRRLSTPAAWLRPSAGLPAPTGLRPSTWLPTSAWLPTPTSRRSTTPSWVPTTSGSVWVSSRPSTCWSRCSSVPSSASR